MDITKDQAELLDKVLTFLKEWEGPSIEFKEYKETKDPNIHLDKIRNAFSFGEYYQRTTGHKIFSRTNDWIDKLEGLSYFLEVNGFRGVYYKQKKEIERDELDTILKRQTISNTKSTRNFAYFSLGVAAITALVPLFIWCLDYGKTQSTKTEVPQLETVIQNQLKLQQSIYDVQKTFQTLDTTLKKMIIVK